LPFLFPRFPEKCAKNNARESAKISLAFSLAFILQIQQIFSNFFAISENVSVFLLL